MHDTQKIFSTRSTPTLLKRLAILKFVSFEWVSKYSPHIMALSEKLQLNWLVHLLVMKPIVFKHFCAAETIEASIQAVKNCPLKPILFLSVEPGTSHPFEWFDQVAAMYANAAREASIIHSFCALKIGGLTESSILKEFDKLFSHVPISAALNFSSNEALSANLEKWQSEYHLGEFTITEKKAFNALLARLDVIFSAGLESGIPQLVDAEQTYYQHVIDFLCLFFMKRYNTENAIVWSTYQMYRKDSFTRLKEHLDLADKNGFAFGFKMVRGAYMDEERRLAKERNYEDPIHHSIDATHKNYNEGAEFVLSLIKQSKPVTIMIASHNENSADLAAYFMKENGIPSNSPNVYFAQLQGMCDHISYSLLVSGFQACKLYPYGPIPEMIPYLIRRLNENKGGLGKTEIERRLIRKELSRRLTSK